MGYSTYFGGSGGDDAFAVAVDAQGNAFVAGNTGSSDFPLLNTLQPDYGGDGDVYLAKFDPDGHLIFSTFLGGSGYDAVNYIALDNEGNVVLVGETRSVDLPSTDDALQYDYAGGSAFGTGDGFIARISPDGSRLLYCSYFGGSGDETITGLAIAPGGAVLITGKTDSLNLPLTNSLQAVFGGKSDGFIVKFDDTLTNVLFSTYFGGEGPEEDARIAVDPAGYIYVSGQTLSTNFPVTADAFQTNHLVVAEIGENWDAYIAKLEPDGSGLVYSTYVGSAAYDAAFAIAADAEGRAYVTGSISALWPEGTFPLGFQPEPGFGEGEAWVARLKPDGSNFDWFSYLGGGADDVGYGLVLDRDGNVLVTGNTSSTDFPALDAVQSRYKAGTWDAFVAKISGDGRRLLYSTYLGGSDEDWGFALAPDAEGNVIAVGRTDSTDFPIQSALQPTNASLRTLERPADGYVVKLTPAIQPPNLQITPSGDFVLLHWSMDFKGYLLESTREFAEPGSSTWQPANGTPLELGGEITVIEHIEQRQQLYRLRRP